MTWCHQAPSHYLSQCWPRSLSPYGITWPQWFKVIAVKLIAYHSVYYWFYILSIICLYSSYVHFISWSSAEESRWCRPSTPGRFPSVPEWLVATGTEDSEAGRGLSERSGCLQESSGPGECPPCSDNVTRIIVEVKERWFPCIIVRNAQSPVLVVLWCSTTKILRTIVSSFNH